MRHIFVTLSGVEGREDSSAGMASEDWQELAPDLAEHPVQVDLLAPLEETSAFPVTTTTEVLAGTYSEIRLKVLRSAVGRPDAGPTERMNPDENRCGASFWHCVVLAGGVPRPLLLGDEGAREASENTLLSLSADPTTGGPVTVLPDSTRSYEIRFAPEASLIFPSRDALRVLPVFLVTPEQTAIFH